MCFKELRGVVPKWQPLPYWVVHLWKYPGDPCIGANIISYRTLGIAFTLHDILTYVEGKLGK